MILVNITLIQQPYYQRILDKRMTTTKISLTLLHLSGCVLKSGRRKETETGRECGYGQTEEQKEQEVGPRRGVLHPL